MTAANRRRGSGFERDLRDHLRGRGFDAERLRTSGAKDEGDLVVKSGGLAYIIEAKATKQIDLPRFITEARFEAANYAAARGCPPVNYAAVVKARGKGISDAYVVMPLHHWLDQIGEEG